MDTKLCVLSSLHVLFFTGCVIGVDQLTRVCIQNFATAARCMKVKVNISCFHVCSVRIGLHRVKVRLFKNEHACPFLSFLDRQEGEVFVRESRHQIHNFAMRSNVRKRRHGSKEGGRKTDFCLLAYWYVLVCLGDDTIREEDGVRVGILRLHPRFGCVDPPSLRVAAEGLERKKGSRLSLSFSTET